MSRALTVEWICFFSGGGEGWALAHVMHGLPMLRHLDLSGECMGCWEGGRLGTYGA